MISCYGRNASCAPNPGLNQYDYFIDFGHPPSDLKEDWSVSNYANVTYNTAANLGAEFRFRKRYDAPQLFTNFYIFFGRVDVIMMAAPGTAMISSAVLMSDGFDEIDWEMSGNDFNLTQQFPYGVVQNNYFSKGITGSYDRGQFVYCSHPHVMFHTYSFDWTPEKLDWLIDNRVVRTFKASDADNNEHQYPQTPSKLQLGIWSGGDPDQNQGTINWAGGITDFPCQQLVDLKSVQHFNSVIDSFHQQLVNVKVFVLPHNDLTSDQQQSSTSTDSSLSATSVAGASPYPLNPIVPSISSGAKVYCDGTVCTTYTGTLTLSVKATATPSSSTTSSPSSATSTSAQATSDAKLVTAAFQWPFGKSKNGLCAYRAFALCKDSGFGDCCSRWGYCGSTEDYCGTNCLPNWGSCLSSEDEKTKKRSEHWWDRRDRAYPPGRRPMATEVV
ncbi:glycosyl hydrolase family 16 [Seiridium cupressi]